jgi:glucans biosynthesis protein
MKKWLLLLPAASLLVDTQAAVFDFSVVRQQAAALAAAPFQQSTNALPASLAELSYEQYQAIHFDASKSLWRAEGLPFWIEFFLPGQFHKQILAFHELNGPDTRAIPFRPEAFLGYTNRSALESARGYAGFRVLDARHGFGEIAVFLDASYYRMVGTGQGYGASGRAVALNTSVGHDEEFPAFREFWLQRPRKGDRELTIYGLLDSLSVAGAVRFTIRPGRDTVAQVKASFCPRQTVREFGLAPITSMFLHGKNGGTPLRDFRPEVHDSDGLLVNNGRDEWIWQPLAPARMIRVNAFSDQNPRGFGLLQRERRFDSFQDLVARFQDRPSVWIRPLGKWGQGAVELIQLPTDNEFLDNITAYWVPARPPEPGSALDLDYEVVWTRDEPLPRNLGYVAASRIGRVVTVPPKDPSHLRFIVDFGGEAVESLSAKAQLTAVVEYGKDVQFINDSLVRNPFNQGWRLAIEIADPGKAVDLRAYLRRGNQQITETWTFTWQP